MKASQTLFGNLFFPSEAQSGKGDYKATAHFQPPMSTLRWNKAYRVFGGPQQNAFIESFNGSLGDELLNEEIFDTLDVARRKPALWRYDYNTVRLHSSLGNQTPKQARQTLEQFEGSTPTALAQPETPNYQNQTCKLLL